MIEDYDGRLTVRVYHKVIKILKEGHKMWAVMDIGTNSSRLLVADSEGETGRIRAVDRALQTTRIGEGMNEKSRTISPEAMERTLHALGDFSQIIAKYPVQKVRLIATQAVREANNKEDLVEKIKNRLGWQLEIVSGEYEAKLSYVGAVQGLESEGIPVVVDIGGGSTELMFKSEKRGLQVQSLPLGALRLLENPLCDEKIGDFLEKRLQNFTLSPKAVLVGVGGTVTTTGAVKLSLVHYAADRVQGLKLEFTELIAIYQSLKSKNLAERLKVPGITSGKEDIIIPGLQILLNLMRHFRKGELIVSDRDLLYGLIYDKSS